MPMKLPAILAMPLFALLTSPSFAQSADPAKAAAPAKSAEAPAPTAGATAPASKATAPAKAGEAAAPRKLQIANKPWTGDFDKMLERRMIRIYSPFSRSLYFSDKGRERGIAVELARDWERYLNVKYAKQLGKRPLTVYIAPATRDKLLPYLADGLSDVSIGNLTVTDERLKMVDFVPGDEGRRTINEVVVTGPASPEVKSIDDLAGKTVHVRRASSYYESLAALNDRFKRDGKPPMDLVLVPDALEDEDMMDMLNVGLLQFIVVDDWKARMWAQVLPKVKARNDLVLREGAKTGWAVRKDSPLLKAEIADFFQNWALKNGVADYRMNTYMKRVKELKDPTGSAEWKRFKETLAIFEKYGNKYGFDPLMLAAQGYQESQLNQQAKSHVGAIGVMQIMPATGATLGVGDIHDIESNIHGGAKYMDQLMTKYFPDAKFSEGNRPLFAFASYNCGPGNVSKARKEAARRGLDPDKWFNNVEIVVAEQIGTETTTYVRNIYKYYVAYKLTIDAQQGAEKARQQMSPAKS
ncbi:MAG TPA: transglycosylase SLT domain-containing protein [Casimicrobiaceae bacterium]|nr:transglycosylase SLT domain-containing protein [Casimicrobiaceae bacterium]